MITIYPQASYILVSVLPVCKLSLWHVYNIMNKTIKQNKILLITTSVIPWRYFCYFWAFEKLVCTYWVPQFCLTLCDPMDCSPLGSSVHGIFPSKNTEVSCHFLLQGIFLTQGSNPYLLLGRWTLYHWATREGLWHMECKF